MQLHIALRLVTLSFICLFTTAPAWADNPYFRTPTDVWDAMQPYNWRGNLRLNRDGIRNGLPPTRMDSFVYEAGAAAEQIYGDESALSLPPINSLTYQNRINAGIFDQRNAGLTTGHGSYLPSAWGLDEFQGNEWSQSGATVTYGDQSVGFSTTPIEFLDQLGLAARGSNPAQQPDPSQKTYYP